jgi:hypothetical protein
LYLLERKNFAVITSHNGGLSVAVGSFLLTVFFFDIWDSSFRVLSYKLSASATPPSLLFVFSFLERLQISLKCLLGTVFALP